MILEIQRNIQNVIQIFVNINCIMIIQGRVKLKRDV